MKSTLFENDATAPDSIDAHSGSARLEQRFASWAALAPDAPALIHRGRELSYGELDRRANRLARHLRDLGVNAGVLVGLCLERSPDLVVSLLAILKAGGAYVPLDPAYPSQRLDFMLRDSASAVLITRDALVRPPLAYDGHIVDLDVEAAAIAARPDHAVESGGSPADLAYVIYTSGSTGEPKGVMLCHTAIAFIDWASTAFTPHEMSRIAATSSICFDPSVFELFAPLCTGGLIILKDDALEPFTDDERPTMLQGVPSVFAKLARDGAIPDSVRIINLGGEVLDGKLVEALYRVSAVDRIYNHYGPTETTTCATVALAGRDDNCNPSIGKSICDARIYLLDEDARRVAAGKVGEIYIAGSTLAQGYLGREAMTAERFLPDPFAPGERMYRTGDLGRMTSSGDLEFVGRIGDQIKLRGFRIELVEIESALMQLSGVIQAAATLKRDGNGRDRLIAYVVAHEDRQLADIRRELSVTLPVHMLPNWLVLLDALPLTLSGKIDRSALPLPDWPKGVEPCPQGDTGSIEELVTRLFQRALSVPHVGANDNFYELGGDSLLAIDIALELETALGQPVPAALLTHAGTPAALASALELRPIAGLNHLTSLQPLGENPPLFCMSGVGGRPTSFISLARHFAPDQPVYNISIGPLEGMLLKEPSIPALSRAYIAEIRTIQPHGPYRISGYSFAGVGAFDLACELEAQGEDVTLILLDCNLSRRLPGLRYIARWAVRAALSSVKEVGWRGALTRAMRLRRVVLRRAPDWLPRHDQEVARTLLRAKANYRFGKFGGKTILVACQQRTLIEGFTNHDGMLGWRDLLRGPVTKLEAQTDHGGLISDPYAEKLAEMLLSALSVTQSRRPQSDPPGAHVAAAS